MHLNSITLTENKDKVVTSIVVIIALILCVFHFVHLILIPKCLKLSVFSNVLLYIFVAGLVYLM